MNHWWRAYNEAVDDPKLQRLAPAAFKSWFNLMCLASKNDGILPPIGDVAFKLHVSESKAAETITGLVMAGLLDKREDGRFEPHNWNGRQYKSDVSTERVQRFRKRKRNVSSDVSETPPDTEAETDSEAEVNSEPASPPSPTKPQKSNSDYDFSGEAGEESLEIPNELLRSPKQGAKSKCGKFIYFKRGTSEFDAYSRDYREGTGDEPQATADGRWFKILGENVHPMPRRA